MKDPGNYVAAAILIAFVLFLAAWSHKISNTVYKSAKVESACLAAGYQYYRIAPDGHAYCVRGDTIVPVEQLGETK